MSDEIILTYHDVTLYRSDVKLLKPPFWLNDSLIAFYYEYLTYELFKEHENQLAFVHPSAIFMIAFLNTSEELKQSLAPLKLPQKQYVFMPINNNSDVNSTGGTHWALLVYSRKENKFMYYDSAGTLNLSEAKLAKQKITAVLDVPSKRKIFLYLLAQMIHFSFVMLQPHLKLGKLLSKSNTFSHLIWI